MTVDRRLGRIPQYDPRNEQYPMRKLWAAELPEIRTKLWDLDVYLDQGDEGSCVGHGYAHELLADPEVVQCDHEGARQIYFDAQRIDPWPGGAYPGADPFYEGTSTLAGAKVLVKRGQYTGYLHATSEEDIARAVSNDGPVVIGVDWTDDMFNPDAQGFIRPTGNLAGGHCLLVVGIDVEGGFYWLHNNWGQSWGIRGRAKIRRADLGTLVFQRGGDAIKLIRSHVEPAPVDPQPQPDPAPVDPEPVDPYEPSDPPACDLWCWLKKFINWLTGGR